MKLNIHFTIQRIESIMRTEILAHSELNKNTLSSHHTITENFQLHGVGLNFEFKKKKKKKKIM